ncbi:DUF3891 family protein [Domibacillus epiphyticus]|uniref:DUF3891 domain-containing protein n=1 Tax=Domibacillus epiphyticus TaxID=1714355 RepID=A0A1V2A8D5_9BACI|nr:DUF3891 family protein [Domibacillus epiphyticus]OMP67275.1 hypothetical protein BTO28_08085 [Domibacillus epiphyticus]
MIISKQGGQLVLVRQDEHGKQAADVARRWGNDQFQKLVNHENVSYGIEKHDAGWKKPDDQVLFNKATKRPLNFMDINLPKHVEFYENGYRETLQEDPYAGMLLGMHWIGLYTSRFGYDPAFTYNVSDDLIDFMDSTIVKIQKEWVNIKQQFWNKKEQRSEFEDHIWMQYEFFQVMDRLSLFMSLNDPMKENNVTLGPVRMSRKSDFVHLHVETAGDGTLTLDPFPFDSGFKTVIPARKIEDRDYENHREAKEIVEKTEKENIEWHVIPK